MELGGAFLFCIALVAAGEAQAITSQSIGALARNTGRDSGVGRHFYIQAQDKDEQRAAGDVHARVMLNPEPG